MTPFFWSVNDDTRARLPDLDALDTEVDVVVHAYRRIGRPGQTVGGAVSANLDRDYLPAPRRVWW